MKARITTEDGHEFEFEGYRPYKNGEWFLNAMGRVVQADRNESILSFPIVKPISKRHTYGGIVFEETGEIAGNTPPKPCWLLNDWGQPYLLTEGGAWRVSHPIVHPVEIIPL